MAKKDLIYEYIRRQVDLRGIPPTIREIGDHFHISSTNGVRYFLDKLEREGLIKRRPKTARGITLVDLETHPDGEAIPLLGSVPAGSPDFAEEFVEEMILLDKKIAGGEGTFAVRVKGDSMVGAGINDGDMAIVKRNPSPRSGEIVVALIEDEVTLKRFVRRGGRVILQPENPDYSEIYLESLQGGSVTILGTVKAIVRKY
jgi:repressor LexA